MHASKTIVVNGLLALTVSSAARADISVVSSSFNLFVNGVSGFNGSSTGSLSDTVGPINATSGTVSAYAYVQGGPIPPDRPPITPGTTGEIASLCAGRLAFNGNSSAMQIHASILNATSMIHMDGGAYAANAQGTIYYTIEVTTPTNYTFSGTMGLDDEDIVGSVLFNGHFHFGSAAGDFSHSGVLNPGMHTFSSGDYLGSAPEGAPGTGDFQESGYFTTTLLLGAPCVDGGPPSIIAQPQNQSSCAAAPFAVAASGGGPYSYQWQIQLPPPSLPNLWVTLDADPLPLSCGGTAVANPPHAAATNIYISPCSGVSQYPVRCIVTNACGTGMSDPATFTSNALKADVNCDCSLDFFDIDPFLLALFDPFAYATAYPNCNVVSADVNGDLSVDFFDIDPFLACLFGTCP